MWLHEIVRNLVRNRKVPRDSSFSKISSLHQRVMPGLVVTKIQEDGATTVKGNERALLIVEER